MNKRKISKNVLLQKKINQPIRFLNNINNTNNKDITNLITGQQIKDEHINEAQFSSLVKRLEAVRPIEINKAYEKRNNAPYKNILPTEYFNKNIAKQEDLIIYKVSEEDKDKIQFKKKVNEIKNTRKIQNNELIQKYNEKDKGEFEKKFNYDNNMKYNIEFNQPMYKTIKEDVNKFYINQQKELEKDKKSIDIIIENVINTSMYDK